MPIKTLKPHTPARRQMSVVDYHRLNKKARPPRKLRAAYKEKAGRNNQGRITVRHRGGTKKRLLRQVDFRRDKREIPGIVRSVEYDPHRSAFLALVVYLDGEKRYHLAWEGIKEGQKVVTSEQVEPTVGNRLPLKHIPVGTEIFNVELKAGRGGKIVRSAGSAAVVRGTEEKYTHLKMPSGEIRLVSADGLATVGRVGNADHRAVKMGSAGRKRRLGVRPSVRGKAMNAVDHPHGGGEGGSPIGLKYPKTPWGKPAHGVKTRPKKKYSNRFIIKRRSK